MNVNLASCSLFGILKLAYKKVKYYQTYIKNVYKLIWAIDKKFGEFSYRYLLVHTSHKIVNFHKLKLLVSRCVSLNVLKCHCTSSRFLMVAHDMVTMHGLRMWIFQKLAEKTLVNIIRMTNLTTYFTAKVLQELATYMYIYVYNSKKPGKCFGIQSL